MASSLTATLDAKLKINTPNARYINAATERIEYALAIALASTATTSVGKATHVYHKRYSLTSSPTTVDLSPVAETDGIGQTITATKIKALLVVNRTTTAGATITVGGNANSPAIFSAANDMLIIRPGGFALLYAPDSAGYAVTGSTGDIINLTASSTADADLIVITEQ